MSFHICSRGVETCWNHDPQGALFQFCYMPTCTVIMDSHHAITLEWSSPQPSVPEWFCAKICWKLFWECKLSVVVFLSYQSIETTVWSVFPLKMQVYNSITLYTQYDPNILYMELHTCIHYWNYIYYIMYSHKVPFYTISIYPFYPHQMTIECDILLGGLNRLLVLNHGMIGWDGEHIFGTG